MGFNLKDPINTLEAYERWLKILVGLFVVSCIGTIVCIYKLFNGTGDSALTILVALTTVMFFFAYREKKAAPRPGSPEYMAIQRQEDAKNAAARERRYRKNHPHEVARELVKNNKVSGRVSSLDDKEK